MNNSRILNSTNYGKFQLMDGNRTISQTHVNNLIKAFEKIGNLTKVTPILVNENYEIIDGQHRFVAAKELGEPVFYTVEAGLTLKDARVMNILHKQWSADDFAASYVEAGNQNYITYMEIKKDYNLNHSTTLHYIANTADTRGLFSDFREGNLAIEDGFAVRERLDMMKEAMDLVPQVGEKDRGFALAFLAIMKSGNYNHARMIRKLSSNGTSHIRKFAFISEYLRALEDCYNHGSMVSNRIHLY